MATELDQTEDAYDREARAFWEIAPPSDQPHWRIVVRPEAFRGDRIEFLKQYCGRFRSYSEKSGDRPYPYIDSDACKRCGEAGARPWIEAVCADEERAPIQHWRFFKSGQFLHFLSFPKDEKSRRLLEADTLVQTITRIFDFAGSLAHDLNCVMRADVRMAGIKNFLFCDAALKIPGKVCTLHTLPQPCRAPTRVQPAAVRDELERQAREVSAALLQCLDIRISERVLKEKQKIHRR